MRKLLTLSAIIAVACFSATNTAQAANSTKPNKHHYSVAQIICITFGPYCRQAQRVAYCESTYNIYATNGQYLGLFQMGSFARARYGHSWSAWGQSKAAYRYFIDSGKDWSPWQCKP